jgi:hypothetical protein
VATQDGYSSKIADFRKIDPDELIEKAEKVKTNNRR